MLGCSYTYNNEQCTYVGYILYIIIYTASINMGCLKLRLKSDLEGLGTSH